MALIENDRIFYGSTNSHPVKLFLFLWVLLYVAEIVNERVKGTVNEYT